MFLKCLSCATLDSFSTGTLTKVIATLQNRTYWYVMIHVLVSFLLSQASLRFLTKPWFYCLGQIWATSQTPPSFHFPHLYQRHCGYACTQQARIRCVKHYWYSSTYPEMPWKENNLSLLQMSWLYLFGGPHTYFGFVRILPNIPYWAIAADHKNYITSLAQLGTAL